MKVLGILRFQNNPLMKRLEAVVEDDYGTLHYLRSGYYLKVFDIDSTILWQGFLENNVAMVRKYDKKVGFIPKGVSWADWTSWLDALLPAEITLGSPYLENVA